VTDALRRPPAFALVASLAMLAVGALSGGVLVRFQDALYDLARAEVVKRPDVHGFAGAEVIDEARIAEVAEQSNNAFRMLHVHGLGVGMLILLGSLAIANLPLPDRLQRALCVLVSLGALYPPGWFMLAWLIPFWGVARLRGPVEWVFFVPFGGALILALWAALAAGVVGLVRRARAARPVSRFGWVLILTSQLGSVLAPSPAGAHLFHKVYAPPETPLTRDARVLQLLLDDPAERFGLARAVYTGELPVELPRRGRRAWLTRPPEPGRVFQADYQWTRSSASLRAEAMRIDRERGTTLAARLEAGLAGRDREAVRAALRAMFVVLLDELLEALWQRLEQPEAAVRLYPYLAAYYSVNLEAHLNIHHPGRATTARLALEAMARALPDPGTGVPASPEAFDQQRRRFRRVLGEAMGTP
jgi:hypothetical protein